MTIFEQTFRRLLLAANLVETRVFFWRAPQVPADKARTPYAVFLAISPSTADYPHEGPLSLQQRDYQVDLYDESQSRVVAIADSYREYLDGYHQTFENVRFGAIFFRQQTSTYELDTKLYHVIQEYRIQFHMLPPAASTTAVQPAVTLDLKGP